MAVPVGVTLPTAALVTVPLAIPVNVPCVRVGAAVHVGRGVRVGVAVLVTVGVALGFNAAETFFTVGPIVKIAHTNKNRPPPNAQMYKLRLAFILSSRLRSASWFTGWLTSVCPGMYTV